MQSSFCDSLENYPMKIDFSSVYKRAHLHVQLCMCLVAQLNMVNSVTKLKSRPTLRIVEPVRWLPLILHEDGTHFAARSAPVSLQSQKSLPWGLNAPRGREFRGNAEFVYSRGCLKITVAESCVFSAVGGWFERNVSIRCAEVSTYSI